MAGSSKHWEQAKRALRGAARRLLRRGGTPPRPGLPEGLAEDELRALVADERGAELASVSHKQLSAWKASGAYRLFLDLDDGSRWTLIFKRADYSPSQIPALAGFPLHPGPPEYQVYRDGADTLGDYLPRVHRTVEVAAGERYDYLLEDLGASCRTAGSAEDLERAARMLPSLHRALAVFVEQCRPEGLLRFDGGFWDALVDYARPSLDGFVARHSSEAVDGLRGLWDELSAIRSDVLGAEGLDARPIHGDYNISNLLVDVADPDRLRVLDWEWTGHGLPHHDLASLLKGEGEAVERRILEVFAEASPERSREHHERLYQWSQLERGVLDAAFLAAQEDRARHVARLDLPWCVDNSARIVLEKAALLR